MSDRPRRIHPYTEHVLRTLGCQRTKNRWECSHSRAKRSKKRHVCAHECPASQPGASCSRSCTGTLGSVAKANESCRSCPAAAGDDRLSRHRPALCAAACPHCPRRTKSGSHRPALRRAHLRPRCRKRARCGSFASGWAGALHSRGRRGVRAARSDAERYRERRGLHCGRPRSAEPTS